MEENQVVQGNTTVRQAIIKFGWDLFIKGVVCWKKERPGYVGLVQEIQHSRKCQSFYELTEIGTKLVSEHAGNGGILRKEDAVHNVESERHVSASIRVLISGTIDEANLQRSQNTMCKCTASDCHKDKDLNA